MPRKVFDSGHPTIGHLALSLSQTVGHKDVANGESSLQDPQLV
jgi:hypothetical protein